MRLRLTTLYGLLFLVSSTGLLAITYVLVSTRLSRIGTSGVPARGDTTGGIVHASSSTTDSIRAAHAADMHQFLVQSGIALAIMAAVSMALGWVMAGRTLRPLRVMTAAARRISDRNLHERLALSGPADELKDLGDTIDGLLGRLDAAFSSQRRFVADASHELRTPLMLTQTVLQVALADPALTLGSLRAACQEVLLTCKEQDRLIQALLTLARSQSGLDHGEPFDLGAITARVLRVREPEATARGLRIDTAIGPAPVSGDPRLVEILVSNLLENAIRHNIPGGHIHVAVSVRRAQNALTVSNSGPHVPADQVERLLQPFQHLDGGRGHDHEGLGLGLSIITAIAAAHDATLSVHPRSAGGLSIEAAFHAADAGRPRRLSRCSLQIGFGVFPAFRSVPAARRVRACFPTCPDW